MSETTTVQTDKLMKDLRSFVADAEELLRATAGQTGEGAAELRTRIQASLARAKDNLADLQESAIAKARAAGHAADDYVHDHPWKSVTVAAGVGLLLGMLISRR